MGNSAVIAKLSVKLATGTIVAKPSSKLMVRKSVVLRFLRCEKGATVVEYAIIATVLSITIIGGISLAFDAIEKMFTDTNSKVNQALN